MIYLVLALVFYSAAILIGAAASRNTNTNLAAALTNVTAAIIPAFVVGTAVAKKAFAGPKYGIFMALLGGVMIAVAIMALNKSFTLYKVGVVTPIVYGGSIVITTVVSYLIYKERLTPLEVVGLIIVSGGIMLIAYARIAAR